MITLKPDDNGTYRWYISLRYVALATLKTCVDRWSLGWQWGTAGQCRIDCCPHMLRMLGWVLRPIITGWNISFWTSATIFPLLFFGDRRRGSSPWISPLRSLRFFCGAFTVENQTRISLWNLTRAGGGNLWALQLSCDSIAEIAHVIQIFYQSMMNCPRNPHTSPGTKMKEKRLVKPFSHAFYSLFMQILYFLS